jgi:DNA-binding NarL/FixJ family response regulator
VLDLSLGTRSGLEVLKLAKQIRPKMCVLILSMHSEEQYAIRAFKAGASGYITKGSTREELMRAIKKVLSGGKYVSPSLAEIMITGFAQDEDKPPHQLLSNRELEVLCLIASGKTVGEIAKQLNLSDKTISTYRTRVLDKMSMKTNAELTHYAIKNSLVS